MLKIINFIMFTLILLFSNSLFADNYFKKNIKYVLENGNHGEHIEVEARIIAQIDKNVFLIKDNSGEMTAYIKNILFHKKMVMGVPFNKTILLTGSVDKQHTIVDKTMAVLKVSKFMPKYVVEASFVK